MNQPSNTETTNAAPPSAAQLADVRQKQWHQQGEALLTLENARSWINAAGLVLFTPRPQIAAPAPSFVEAVLGAPSAAPALDQLAPARDLLARLVAEGLAVPLNLLGLGAVIGHAGDTPDFIASTAAFTYIFTLRGDKAWKQPPESTGALKVSHLAVAAHEALTRRGPLSTYDLTTELGKEVTEAAVLRALGELWSHLRVLPLPQTGGGPTVWELTSTRFIKQIKAGANAGQPTALSALISLYLGQAVVASEEEIESFLSPLAARSRIRDVVHALLSARQLDTLAIEGRTMLHVAGAPPAILAPQPQLAIAAEESASSASREIAAGAAAIEGDDSAASAGADTGADEVPSRIVKFIPVPRKVGTGYLAKARPVKFAGKPSSPKQPSAAGPGEDARPKSDRERRPFVQRDDRERGASGGRPPRKTFGKPDEARPPRKSFSKPDEGRPPRKTFGKPSSSASGDRPARKPFAKFDSTRPPRKSFSKSDEARPPRKTFGKPSSGASGDRPTRKPFAKFDGTRPPRKSFSKSDESRPPRKTFSKAGSFDRKREGFAARPSGDARPSRSNYPPRGDARPSERPRRTEGSIFAPRKPRSATGSAGFAPRKFSGKPSDKPGGDFAPRKFAGKPSGKPGVFAGKSNSKPGGGFAGKKPFAKFAKPFSAKPKSAGAAFAGKKPFGKRPAGRSSRPPRGESA